MSTTALDPAAYDSEVERNYRWNFWVNVLDGTFFFFGISFIADSTVIPLYVAHLTDSRVLIGLAAAIAGSAWFLPQLLTANFTERLARKKPMVVKYGLLAERLPVLLLALSSFLLASSQPGLALALFFLFYAWHKLGSGSIAPAWEDMMAKVIPLDRRGRFFGIANFGGSLLGVVGAQVTAVVLARYAFPDNFALCMALAFVGVFLSWVFLALNREPALSSGKEHVSTVEYWRRLPTLLRADRNFSRYLLTRALMGLGRMSMGFVTVYAVQRWDLPDSQAGIYTTILLVSQTLFNLAFGYLGDRRGHKRSLAWGLWAWIAATGLAFFAPSPQWFYLVFLAWGMAIAAEMVGGLMILLEFAGPEDRPTYVGLGNTVTGIFNAVAPVLGGWIASLAGYRPLFVISALLTLSAWAVLHWDAQRIPRTRTLAESQLR